MPRATVASRELNNKDTGLDLFVPNFKEVKNRLTSTVYYQVVVVSNLSFFKTPSHKETDVVQCSFEKKWADFEDLRNKISEAFSGTVLPVLEKKSFIVNDAVLKERRNSIEAFMKFLASVAKLAVSAPLLQFLGVDSVRANKVKQDNVAEGSKDGTEDTNDVEPDVDVFGEAQDTQDGADLFDDGDDTEEFTGGNLSIALDDESKERRRGSISMFEEQDLKREIDEEDEKDFNFVPDAIITKRERVTVQEDDGEGDDLFKIEDDLDQLMVVDVGTKRNKQNNQTVSEASSAKPTPKSKPIPPGKPSPTTKPTPSAKPTASSKPIPSVKPTPATKPTPSSKPNLATKPSVPSKPGTSTSSPSTTEESNGTSAEESVVDTMQQDDLLAYLQDNMSSNAEEVDLFS